MVPVKTARLADLVRLAPCIPEHMSCKETLDMALNHPESKCMIVIDKDDCPVGLVMNDRFFLRVTGPRGADLFWREPISKLMSRMPLIADLECPVEALAEEAGRRHAAMREDCIVVVHDGKAAGIVEARDLLLF